MSFLVTFKAVAEIIFISIFGYLIVKKKILSSKSMEIFSKFIIDVTLPCFIISNFIQGFNWSNLFQILFFPLYALVIILAGVLLGYLLAISFKVKKDIRGVTAGISAIGNYGYLPMALVIALLPPSEVTEALIDIFFFVVVGNLLTWSWGIYLITHKKKKFRPGIPFYAALLGLAIGGSPAKEYIPHLILEPLSQIGKITIPLALFTLGGILATFSWKDKELNKKSISISLLVKLLLLPLIVCVILRFIPLAKVPKMVVIIEAASPPAVALSLIATRYKSNASLVSASLFIAYLISIFTLPLFLAISM